MSPLNLGAELQKTRHVIPTQRVHWRCWLETSYKHSSYCCLRVKRGVYHAVAWQWSCIFGTRLSYKMFIAPWPSYALIKSVTILTYTTLTVNKHVRKSGGSASLISKSATDFRPQSVTLHFNLKSYFSNTLLNVSLPLRSLPSKRSPNLMQTAFNVLPYKPHVKPFVFNSATIQYLYSWLSLPATGL
jgi:hypothetical protein